MNAPHMPIPFPDAKTFRLHFGKHNGKTVDEVASTDAGLLYLDWMRGHLRLDFHTRNAVCSYLDHPTIAADLAKLVRP